MSHKIKTLIRIIDGVSGAGTSTVTSTNPISEKMYL